MSIKISSRVWEQSPNTGNLLLLTMALADEANDLGISWPGLPYLVNKARTSRAQTFRNLAKLEEQAEVYAYRPEKIGRGKFVKYIVLTGMSDSEIGDALESLGAKEKGLIMTPLKQKRVSLCYLLFPEKGLIFEEKGLIRESENLPDFSVIEAIRRGKHESTPVLPVNTINTDSPNQSSEGLSESQKLRKELDEAKAEIAKLLSAVKAKGKDKEPLPWSALTKTMFEAIPEKIRPVRVAYHRHNVDARALYEQGITEEQVRDFVQWKYATDHWMWTGSNNTAVIITMSMVANSIRASSEKVRDWVLKGRNGRAETPPPTPSPKKNPNEPDGWRDEPIEGNPGAFRRVPYWND